MTPSPLARSPPGGLHAKQMFYPGPTANAIDAILWRLGGRGNTNSLLQKQNDLGTSTPFTPCLKLPCRLSSFVIPSNVCTSFFGSHCWLWSSQVLNHYKNLQTEIPARCGDPSLVVLCHPILQPCDKNHCLPTTIDHVCENHYTSTPFGKATKALCPHSQELSCIKIILILCLFIQHFVLTLPFFLLCTQGGTSNSALPHLILTAL